MKSLYSASACARPCAPPSRIPAVGDGQLRLGQIFAGVVGVDQRVQRQARGFVVAVLDVLDGPVEQNLVRLQSVFGDRRFVLLVPERKPKPEQQEEGEQARGYDEIVDNVAASESLI